MHIRFVDVNSEVTLRLTRGAGIGREFGKLSPTFRFIFDLGASTP